MPTMLRSLLTCAGAIAVLATTASCAGLTSSAPDARDVVLRFDDPAALDDWHVAGGEWRVVDGRLVGCSLDPSGQLTNEYATYRTFFGDIDRVILRGGLDASSPHNFRMAVGAALQLFDWELADANWFRYGHQEWRVDGAALVPGREHEIVVEHVDGRVRVVVDDRLMWERAGRLQGTISLHPCFGSRLWVREIVIRGRPVPWIAMDGPTYPIL
jgi:hypothetical protein